MWEIGAHIECYFGKSILKVKHTPAGCLRWIPQSCLSASDGHWEQKRSSRLDIASIASKSEIVRFGIPKDVVDVTPVCNRTPFEQFPAFAELSWRYWRLNGRWTSEILRYTMYRHMQLCISLMRCVSQRGLNNHSIFGAALASCISQNVVFALDIDMTVVPRPPKKDVGSCR